MAVKCVFSNFLSVFQKNMGMAMPSWYDIVGLDKRSNEFCTGIEKSQHRIEQLLMLEHDNLGVPYDRMVLSGFSQGGALSLYTGMQLPSKLAGIAIMSGYLPHESGFNIANGLESTPIWHGHGVSDPLVKITAANESQSAVKAKGATNYTLKTYPGLAHSVNPQEISDVLSFLQTILPPGGGGEGEFKVKLKEPSEMSVKELRGAIAKAGLGRLAVGLMEKREFVELLQNHRDGKL
jgi:lysophospholipase II